MKATNNINHPSALSGSLFNVRPEADSGSEYQQLVLLINELTVCLNGAKSDLTTLSRFVSHRTSGLPSGLKGSNTGVSLDCDAVTLDLKAIDTILKKLEALSGQIKPRQWQLSVP